MVGKLCLNLKRSTYLAVESPSKNHLYDPLYMSLLNIKAIFCLLGLLIGISPNCVPFIHEYTLYTDTLILFLNHLSHPKKESKMYVTNVNFYS